MSEYASPRFRWLERGEGEPVVLLHGLMAEMDHWESALEKLGAFCRPIALELPIFDAALVDLSPAGLAGHVRRPVARRILRMARATRQHNVEARLGELRVPTLLMWGKDDRIIRGSQLAYLPNCSPMLECPEAFDAIVSDWLVEKRERREEPVAGSGDLQ